MKNVSDGSRGQQGEEMAHWRREEIVVRKEKVFKGRDVARGRLARSNTEMYQRVGTRVNVEARSMIESTSHLAREYPVASSLTGTLLSVYLGDGRRAPGRKREDKKSANLRRRVKRRPVLDASTFVELSHRPLSCSPSCTLSVIYQRTSTRICLAVRASRRKFLAADMLRVTLGRPFGHCFDFEPRNLIAFVVL